jgi:hypothetical protein
MDLAHPLTFVIASCFLPAAVATCATWAIYVGSTQAACAHLARSHRR